MAAGKLLNLLALTALALLASSLGPAPVNALSTGHIQHARHIQHAQEVASKRKRDTSQRCKPRPSSSAPASTTASSSAAPSASKDAVVTSTSHTAAPSQPPKSSAAPPKSSAAPAPPKSSPAPPSNNAPTSLLSTSGGKFGLGWPNGDQPNILKNFVTSRVHSMYTWSPSCPSNTEGLKCMPMMWGDKDAAAMPALLANEATDNNNLVLFINEPNEPGQSNMTPQHACDLYHQYLKPAEARGYKFIMPATSSNPNGLTWVQNFRSCCTDCDGFVGTAIHWYDTTLEKFQTYVNLWHDTFGMPIYITEYALQNFNGGPQPSAAEVTAFHLAAAAWLESQSFVETYMPFGVMTDMSGVNDANRLMNSDGTPTALGTALLDGNF
ncbi:hypothetical protein EUX98_g414 [Antrodiella citrinella]|uniref:Asl1-like glycosyl hydrolase catalytic domain-containing protein n=1 Tax=Antrodiella citrinella TaxID=2447956 RepID=A0A4S4N5J7_9APHY|nr:hypothetical protein EUX98_g414 [Antrodiella citrinella]